MWAHICIIRSVCTLIDAFIQVHFARFCTVYVRKHIIIIIIMTALYYYCYRVEMSINYVQIIILLFIPAHKGPGDWRWRNVTDTVARVAETLQ